MIKTLNSKLLHMLIIGSYSTVSFISKLEFHFTVKYMNINLEEKIIEENISWVLAIMAECIY